MYSEKTLKEQITVLTTYLEAYGRHYEWCAGIYGQECKCSWLDALKEAQDWRDKAVSDSPDA